MAPRIPAIFMGVLVLSKGIPNDKRAFDTQTIWEMKPCQNLKRTTTTIPFQYVVITDSTTVYYRNLSQRGFIGKVSKTKLLHLCQRLLDQAGCKSKDVHDWQGHEGESQQANPQDRLPQYFSENLPHT
ncbi:Uncharacterized protein Fot_55082 [Forsythia ovata]|uniref:Uncharacterized protein n=1 Tax=Forsythia ovata TaxID=205694 RepID=A0ABD1P5B3_9LAMI